ncbi:hypothetical protein BDR26DRAFT_621044 [Obelidium mucronatum]|nr:hypothetical protein BDR26DRAFT_621044 [Obelidium mucronatum]
MTTSNITTFAGTTNAEVLKIFNYDVSCCRAGFIGTEILFLNLKVCLPIFALGVLLNGAVTLTAAVARKRLITNRLDGFLVLLTFVVLLWCLLSTIRPLVELTSTATFPTNVIKLYTSFFLLLIFGVGLGFDFGCFVLCGKPTQLRP